MEFTNIYSTIDYWEVSIIKNLFDERQISYVVPEEVKSSSSGLAAFGMSGIRVQVPTHQQEEAVGILKEHGFVL